LTLMFSIAVGFVSDVGAADIFYLTQRRKDAKAQGKNKREAQLPWLFFSTPSRRILPK